MHELSRAPAFAQQRRPSGCPTRPFRILCLRLSQFSHNFPSIFIETKNSRQVFRVHFECPKTRPSWPKPTNGPRNRVASQRTCAGRVPIRVRSSGLAVRTFLFRGRLSPSVQSQRRLFASALVPLSGHACAPVEQGICHRISAQCSVVRGSKRELQIPSRRP